MDISELGDAFFRVINERIGPFDRPMHFRVFPFDAGGSLNFLTVGRGRERFVTYVSWDLFGHAEQKRGSLGRYELLTVCDEEEWCIDVLTKIGRQSLQEVFQPGDTLDIGAWVKPIARLQGVVFEEAFRAGLKRGKTMEPCGLLRCIGVTRSELDFALRQGSGALIECLKTSGVYPRTEIGRESIPLPNDG
jgi:hypothetical protein